MKALKFNLNKKILRNILILIPFFELLTFDELVGMHNNTLFWELILTLYSLLRIALTGYALVRVRKRIECKITVIGILFFVLSENICSLLNGSIYINYFIGSLTIIGLALNCDWMMRESKEIFIKSCYLLFGFYSTIGVLSVLIWPNGFFNAHIKAYAIYFLGSKNTGFFYYIIFLFFATILDININGKPRRKTIFWIILFIIVSYICDAASAQIIFLVLLISYLMWRGIGCLFSKNFMRTMIIMFFALTCLILVPQLRHIFTSLFKIFGRDITFTGRDLLWEQASLYFLQHPLIGNGINTKYILGTGAIADHAHSQYLDILAKYGIITFILFILPVIIILKRIFKHSEKKKLLLSNLILLAFLLHSVLDHLMIYNFVLLLIAIEGLVLVPYARKWRNLK